MTRRIGFLLFPDFEILDLTGPMSAFHAATTVAATTVAATAVAATTVAGSAPAYRLAAVSAAGGSVPSTCGLAVATEMLDAEPFDTLVVVGGRGAREPASPERLVAYARRAAPATRRLAGVCTGAFILGAAGLLDGRRATTHWRHAATLQRLYPRSRIEADRIFVADGAIWTSAGITAGIDLALALIEADLGLAVSRAVARELVVYHRRPGGQSQFSALLDMDPPSDRIRNALSFARDHLDEALPVKRLAQAACLSPRQFGRAFRHETGQTPAKAIERLRAEAARARIEDGREPIEAIARAVGFADPERMRRAFIRSFGQPPQALRRKGAAHETFG